MEREGRSDATLSKAHWFLKLLDSDIGKRPISAITPHELLEALRRVERRGHHETAQRLRAFASRIFRFAFNPAHRTQSGRHPARRADGAAGQASCRNPGAGEGRRTIARDRRLRRSTGESLRTEACPSCLPQAGGVTSGPMVRN
ncbi:phage integrase central domain-containing protein [Sphingomonas oryzagri]